MGRINDNACRVFFGIMKGRWRILKTGIRLEGVDSVDNIWLTYCALHNWLLEIDVLDDNWNGEGILTSDWEVEMGDHDSEGPSEPIARLTTTLNPRIYNRAWVWVSMWVWTSQIQ